ncbi:unnamed protein product [Ectocarpus sp. CCAP 1310/34]|nr:unnamed protein product [Ectocarpus sp. CCAP 1310/34]
MIDQDYAELLGRSPPSGEVLEWTFPARALADAFVLLLVGTPALCCTLYMTGFSREESFHSGGAELRIPTLTQLGMRNNPVGFTFRAGIQLAAIVAIPLFWCVKLAHHQRLQARTGVARYDIEAEGAIRWVTGAWITGALGAILMYAAASVPGEEGASFSPQGVTHLVLTSSAACGILGQAVCTAWALRKARLVFVVSDGDLVAYKRKLWLASTAVIVAVVAVLSVLIVECVEGGTWNMGWSLRRGAGAFVGGSGSSSIGGFDDETAAVGDQNRWEGNVSSSRDCDTEWCYSRSLLGLWEYLLLAVEAGFCMALRHDLAPATGGVGVESFVL